MRADAAKNGGGGFCYKRKIFGLGMNGHKGGQGMGQKRPTFLWAWTGQRLFCYH